jgi:hypothetical protein
LPDATVERWTALLDELERDVLSATGADAEWRPPTGLGPIPAELVGRARKLATAQQEVMAALEEEKDSTRRHLAALRALPQQRNETAPLYLDASG